MSVTPERAREACESCRRSHKRCIYDDNSTQCLRCEKRNAQCSLFSSVATTAVAQQGPPALVTTGFAPEMWDGTPHGSAASSNLPYDFYLPQGQYYMPNTDFTETTQREYPADVISGSRPPVSGHESVQPAMNQEGLYEHNNVFQ